MSTDIQEQDETIGPHIAVFTIKMEIFPVEQNGKIKAKPVGRDNKIVSVRGNTLNDCIESANKLMKGIKNG